jgi:superfamily II DNA or RNA helicase
MKCVLTDDAKFIRLVNFTAREIDQIKYSLTKKIKGHYFHPLVKKGLWDGKISFIDKYHQVPAGLYNELEKICTEFNIPFDFNGLERIVDLKFNEAQFKEFCIKLFEGHPKFTPRDYQIDSAAKILKFRRSISEIATSAGKTMIIYMIFAYLKKVKGIKKVLMVVPNKNLVTQCEEDFEEYSMDGDLFPYRMQKIGGGSSKDKKDVDFVVGTYHTLRNLPDDFYEDIGAVVVDEAHSTNAMSVKTVLSKLHHAEYKFGLSGTMLQGDDADSYTVQAFLGPLINKISPKFLFDEKYATPVKIKMVILDYLEPDLKEKLAKIRSDKRKLDGKQQLVLEKKVIVSNEKRLQFIVDFISKIPNNSLVLFSNVKDEYGKKIYQGLKETGNKIAYYIDGGTDSEQRDYFKKELEEGDNRVLIASFGTFAEGISIKAIHNIFLVESYKSERIVKQSIGRGMRLHELKDFITIYDFIDDFRFGDSKNFMIKHGEERIKIYKAEEFPYEILKAKF